MQVKPVNDDNSRALAINIRPSLLILPPTRHDAYIHRMVCSLKNLTVLGLQGNDLRDIPPCFADLKKLATFGKLSVVDLFDDCSNIRSVNTDFLTTFLDRLTGFLCFNFCG